MSKLTRDFYIRPDVVQISKELLGKCLFTRFEGKTTSGIITETEAYAGVKDKASHAFNNRRTARTEMMYSIGGTSYVYLCYGIHHLFNIVTNEKDIPHAILIRAVKPEGNLPLILRRRNIKPGIDIENIPPVLLKKISGGPGTVSAAMGIKTRHSGYDLLGKEIWLEDRGIKINEKAIISGPRVGVDYAGEDAKLPYRFWIEKLT